MKISLGTIKKLSIDTKKIFDLIQKKGSKTKNRTLLITNKKLSALNRIMQTLLEQNLIVEKDIASNLVDKLIYDLGINRKIILRAGLLNIHFLRKSYQKNIYIKIREVA